MEREVIPAVPGVCMKVLSDTLFNITLEENGRELLCHVSGKMRKHFYHIVEGDRVMVEPSPDSARGRITSQIR